ncbi:MAG TPA: ATP-binding protein, partial [Micromonosporaceae bacterium]|nr:ATP-binding protein [Micromonosporaceae bacterium]
RPPVAASQQRPPVAATIWRDFTAGSTHVTLESARPTAAASDLADVLRRAALDAPLAVIVDINRLVARDVVAIGPLLPGTDGPGSGTPLFLSVNPLTPGGRMARAVLPGHVLICDSAADATAVAGDLAATKLRAHAHLPASRRSPAAARRLVESTCRAWGADQLAQVAMVVASELVSNSVEHAGTDLDVGISVGAGAVRIGVRDRTAEPPQRPDPEPAPASEPAPGTVDLRSRGLLIVSALAANWGFLMCGDGKSVWATVGGARGIRSTP